MSLIRQCDRCKQIFQPYVQVTGCKGKTNYVKLHVMHSRYLENVYDGNDNKYWDLCQECAYKLNQFLESTNMDVTEKEINSGSVVKSSTELENVPGPDESGAFNY